MKFCDNEAPFAVVRIPPLIGFELGKPGLSRLSLRPITCTMIKVFPSTDCPYRGVKVTCFGKSVTVLTREFSTFAIKPLQNNTILP